jgi:hypothetical protein
VANTCELQCVNLAHSNRCFQILLHKAFFLKNLLCWVGVHCSIYKSSYNVSSTSYLNSPSPLFSFTTKLPVLITCSEVSFCLITHGMLLGYLSYHWSVCFCACLFLIEMIRSFSVSSKVPIIPIYV